MTMAQERARLAREQAEAKAAIAADNRAVQPTHTATTTAITDVPFMLDLQSTSATPMLPAAEVMSNHHTYAKLPEQHRQALDRGGEKLFRGATVAAIWKEWRHGGDCPCVKSLLREAKSNGRLTLRGTGKEEQKVKTEPSKKRRLPEAIETLTEWGLPEHEAVRQVDELLLMFGVTKICPKFDAFLYKHQMNHPKKGVDPK